MFVRSISSINDCQVGLLSNEKNKNTVRKVDVWEPQQLASLGLLPNGPFQPSNQTTHSPIWHIIRYIRFSIQKYYNHLNIKLVFGNTSSLIVPFATSRKLLTLKSVFSIIIIIGYTQKCH